MRKFTLLISILMVGYLLPSNVLSQGVTVSGTIRSTDSKDVIPAVTVSIVGTSAGTFTNDKGYFKLSVPGHFPLTLLISSIGFATQKIQVSSPEPIQVSLDMAPSLGQDIVVSATRVPVKLLESPVSIERLGKTDILETPSVTFYDALSHLNGVDVVTSSLTFTTLGTRGFNGSGNLRMNQLTDGMDNQAPGLNFSVGNIVGLAELDVDNVELLPGASSALYGAGGMNGTLLITSKDPFKYQGFSIQTKEGVNHLGDPSSSAEPYYDWQARYAHAFNNKIAFKLSGEYTAATDWYANDARNYSIQQGQPIAGSRAANSSYNGINVYGDEINFNVNQAMRAAGYGAFIPPGADSIVSRTGYNEKDIVDYNTYNLKLDAVLAYKITNTTVASLTAYWGMASTVYSGSDRYDLKDVKIGQYKAEVKGRHFYVRGYTTQENSGNSYNATVMAQLMDEAWSPTATQWAPTYVQNYVGALATPGTTYNMAQMYARGVADTGRFIPGSPAFEQAFNAIKSKPIPEGALFVDRTDLYVAEGMYDFSDQIKWADVQVGASYRRYELNSEGTLFADTTGPIGINQYGAFAQVQKSFLNNVLRFSAAGRYDKNDNFQGRFTPRLTGLIKVAKDNFIRLSYQNAYRFPSTQNQYINLNTGSARLIGGLPQFQTFFNLHTDTYDTATFYKAQAGQGPLTQYQFKTFKPESVNSYEVGYKGIVRGQLLIDFFAFYAQYTNFITDAVLIHDPGSPDQATYVMSVNSPNKVNTYGSGLSLNYLLPHGFIVGGNVLYNKLSDADKSMLTFFNTPAWKFNLSLGNYTIAKRYGFNVTYRWQEQTIWQDEFISGTVPAYGTLDAQVSMKFPEIRSVIKLGGTNVINKYYYNAMGNAQVGALFYVSFGYNIF